MNLARAIEFVRRKGNAGEVERLRCILEGSEPNAKIVREFEELQNPDGGFPLRMEPGRPSTINDSTVALVRLEEFNLQHGGTARKVARFLLGRQAEDGSWNEDEGIDRYGLPPWMDPRNPPVRLYCTAYAGFWLTKLGYGKGEKVGLALALLEKHRRETGAFEGFRHTTWIATSLFAATKGTRCRVAAEGLRFLGTIPEEQWASSQLSWMLWCLGSSGYTKANRVVARFLDLLFARQSADGSFASEDGLEFSANATIEAIKVFKSFRVER